MKPTYEQMARDLGLDLCRSLDCPRDHFMGDAEPGRIHFTDIRFSWPGVKRFLRLAAIALDPNLSEVDPFWLYLYRLNIAARDAGRKVRVRVPIRFFKLDKLMILAGVAGISNEVPMRKQAYDWARR